MNKISGYKTLILFLKKVLAGMVICFIFSTTSCKKFVEIGNPITNVTELNVYSSDGTAAAVLTNLYVGLRAYHDYGVSRCYYVTGLLGDEIALYNKSDLTLLRFYSDDITSVASPDDMWGTSYERIYITNAALVGLNESTSLTPSTKKQLLGEAKFMRAFYYFYLVNLYGDVPLALSTDYIVNSVLPRTSKDTVYQQIIKDLKQADSLMSDKYVDGFATNETSERVRPSKWAVKALLARTYLYTGEWAKAEAVASEIINHTALFELLPLDQVFLKNSRETIWAIQSIRTFDIGTIEGLVFVLPSTGPGEGYPVYLSDFVVQAFEPGDQRKKDWIGVAAGYYYPYKYKAGRSETSSLEYSIILRLTELYLIRAEARIRQGRIAEGIADLNKVRDRATDKAAPAADRLKQLASNLSEDKAIEAVLHERYVELFTEWGHRWLDLKRLNAIDDRMKIVTPAKGGTEWKPHLALFPIPPDELQKNPSLRGHQNPGYIE